MKESVLIIVYMSLTRPCGTHSAQSTGQMVLTAVRAAIPRLTISSGDSHRFVDLIHVFVFHNCYILSRLVLFLISPARITCHLRRGMFSPALQGGGLYPP